MIELAHVTKKYGAVTALRDVNLHVKAGETLGLLGRNGAGKTTALNVITGYFPPTEGRVAIGGTDMLRDPRGCKRMIGYLPERPPLYDEMTVEDYLLFVSELREVVRKARRAHVDEILELCALTEVRRRVIGHLSKGYRQRTGIAQALCGSPEILILDEPTVGLDPRQTAEMRELIRRLGAEHTVIFSSHILGEVQQICTRAVILHGGRIKRSLRLDTGDEGTRRLRLRAAGEEETLKRALGALPCVREIETLPAETEGEACFRLVCEGTEGNGRAEDRIFRTLAGLDAPIRSLQEEQDTLEEIFLRETED